MPKNEQSVAAIVPAYNEEKTIRPILETLKNSSWIDEVILVSDGSTDRTDEIGRQTGVKVYNLPVNKGKGKAMQHGVAHTDAEIIVFFDADLYGLNEKHIEKIVRPVLEGEKAMNVAIRDRGTLRMKIAAHLPLIGGERAMLRHVFEAVPEEYKQGFMVEAALNYYCRSRKLNYGTTFCYGLTFRKKMAKVGFFRGFWQYVKMFYQVLKAILIVRWAKLIGKF